MTRFLIFILILTASLGVQAREIFNINREWQFFSDVEISSDGAATVNLPHIWNNDALSGKKDYFRGIGNYQKTISIPADWNDRRVFIKFYGTNTVTALFVNGRHVGEHRGGYTAFAFEITDRLLFGRENDFWIVVNNAPRLDILPTAGDANVYGGIFRNVELIITGAVAISPTDYGSDGIYIIPKKITAQQVEAEAVVKVIGAKEGTAQVNVALLTPRRDTVARAATRVKLSGDPATTATLPFTIANPALWSGTEDPFLYTVAVTVGAGSTVTDSVAIQTGFRTVAVNDAGEFLLNGKPYPIHGVVVHQDRAMVGPALQSYQVREDFNLIRGMGANFVRVAGVAHNPEFYDLCDRHGILVWSDAPLVGPAYLTDKAYIPSSEFMANGKSQMTELIRQQYNRPSVVMWGIFSDLTARGDNPIPYVRELNALAKREGPSRLTVAASNQNGEINFVTDLICWNHHFGWIEGKPSDIGTWQQYLHARWDRLRSAVSYAAGASIYHQDDSLYRPPYMGNWHPERWQTYLHEQYYAQLKDDRKLWGIVVGNMFDYGAVGRTWGEGNGINDCGLVTFDRKYCKDAYFFYKANWDRDEGFVYIAERRWQARRNTVQNIKVYSNRDEVELFVNGISQGTKSGTVGIFTWPGVVLNAGMNRIEARSGSLTDRISLEILNSRSRSAIPDF